MNEVTNINQIQVREAGYRQVFGDQDLDVIELPAVTLSHLLLSLPLAHHLDLLLPDLVLLVHVADVDHLLDQQHRQPLHLTVAFLQRDLNLGSDLQ